MPGRQGHPVWALPLARTIDIIGRFAGVMMGLWHTEQDVKDVIAAIRKVYPAIGLGERGSHRPLAVLSPSPRAPAEGWPAGEGEAACQTVIP